MNFTISISQKNHTKMPNYIINIESHTIEVRDEQAECKKKSASEKTRSLGWFSDINAALHEAKKTFPSAQPCSCCKQLNATGSGSSGFSALNPKSLFQITRKLRGAK